MNKLSVFLISLFFSATIFAQTYLDVTPGYGTLNQAISQNQGNVIYRLQAGQWYGLNGVIQNSTFKLIIIGTTPPNDTTMPAMIQVGSDANGVPFSNMISAFDDVTLKNLFIVDANTNNVQANGPVITMQAKCTVKIDSVVFDPLGVNNQLIDCGSATNPNVFMTNSMVLRSGQETDPNDGNLFTISGAPTNGVDTLYIENNTFVNTGTWFFNNENFNTGRDNFIWVNHNTFIFHKSQLFWTWYTNDQFFTNNLLFDFNTQPWVMAWNAFFPDGSAIPETKESRFSLINADTLFTTDANGNKVRETFPSIRKNFAEYNLDYTDPRIEAIPTTWAESHTLNNDGKTPIPLSYLMPLVQPKDSSNVSREAQIFNDHINFPGFKYGNTYTDVDPQWTEQKIYQLQDSLSVWSLLGCELHTWGFDPSNLPPVSQWPLYWWNADSNGMGNPTKWPRFDGTYKNPQILTASIEGLPLGDLNWFPAAKATWQAHKTEIMNYILAENVSPMNLTSSETAVSSSNAAASLGASNVIDNDPNTFWASAPHASANAEEWIYIDLGSSQNVTKVVLVPRAVNDTVVLSFPEDFKIQYSSDASNWTDVPGQSYTNYPIPSNNDGEVFTFASPVNCRYVRVDATKLRVDDSGTNYYFQLAEFHVYNTVTAVKSDKEIVKDYNLSQNYPNPFNPSTRIDFNLQKSGMTKLEVYNILGQRVVTLINGNLNAGQHSVVFDADNLPSGIYLYTLSSGSFMVTKKMMLLK